MISEQTRKTTDEIMDRIILLNAMLEREISALKNTYDIPQINYLVSKAHNSYDRFVEQLSYLLKMNESEEESKKLKDVMRSEIVDDLSEAFAYMVDLTDIQKSVAVTMMKDFRDGKIKFEEGEV